MAVGLGGVEVVVVLHIDEELRGGRVGVAGAGHGHGVFVVLQAVAGLQRNRRTCGFLLQVGGEATALDHEAVDHAVEHGAVVVLVVHILQKVGNRFGGLGRVELQHDVTGRRGQLDAGRSGLCGQVGRGQA